MDDQPAARPSYLAEVVWFVAFFAVGLALRDWLWPGEQAFSVGRSLLKGAVMGLVAGIVYRPLRKLLLRIWKAPGE